MGLEARNGDRNRVEQVSCDMSPAYIKGVKEFLPQAAITFDKFHIVKLINAAVDEVRKLEVASQPILRNSRYILLKNENSLTSKEKTKLDDLKMPKLNLKSIRALHIRENFQAIYDAETEEEFEALLKKWYFWATHSRLQPIIDVAKTIKAHWDGVIAWKKSQINNGILEGLNSIVQAAKAKARGYKTFKNFKIIIFLLTGKLEFEKLNPNIGHGRLMLITHTICQRTNCILYQAGSDRRFGGNPCRQGCPWTLRYAGRFENSSEASPLKTFGRSQR